MDKASAKYRYTTGSSIEERKLLSRLLAMASSNFFLLTVLLALAASGAIASDPSPLQDFCVADKDTHGMCFSLHLNHNTSVSHHDCVVHNEAEMKIEKVYTAL